MQKYRMYLIAIGFFLLSLLIGYIVLSHLPAQVASHWNAQGQADGYTTRISSILFMPIISLVLSFVILFAPTLDPNFANIKKFQNSFHWFAFVFMSYFFYIHLLTLALNLGYTFNLIQAMAPGFSALFYACGVMISKAESNWTIGIRTPWTLSNPEVWRKTHELGGKAFKITALITLFGLIFPSIGIWLMLVPVLATSLGLTTYSYLLFKKLQQKESLS